MKLFGRNSQTPLATPENQCPSAIAPITAFSEASAQTRAPFPCPIFGNSFQVWGETCRTWPFPPDSEGRVPRVPDGELCFLSRCVRHRDHDSRGEQPHLEQLNPTSEIESPEQTEETEREALVRIHTGTFFPPRIRTECPLTPFSLFPPVNPKSEFGLNCGGFGSLMETAHASVWADPFPFLHVNRLLSIE